MESTSLISLIFSNCIAVISQQYARVPSCVPVNNFGRNSNFSRVQLLAITSSMERHLQMFKRNETED